MNVKVDNFTSMKLTHEITWNNTLHFAILAFSFDGETNTKIMRILCRGLLMFPEMVLTRAPNEPSQRFHNHESLRRSPNLMLTYRGLTPVYHSVLTLYCRWVDISTQLLRIREAIKKKIYNQNVRTHLSSDY